MNAHFWTLKKIIVAAVLAVIVVVVAVSVSVGSHKVAVPTVSTPSSAPASSALPTQAPTAPSAPAMTPTQQQAVEAAQQYLTGGEGFSAEGLAQQLTSSYGNGFTNADAQFAIKYLNPDWDAQAVEAARGYMASEHGWSQASLAQQLTSAYGSGFTEAQAAYAVGRVLP